MGKRNYSADFESLAQENPRPGSDYLLAMGLDFGNSTGYAYTWFRPEAALRWEQPLIAGQIDLSAGNWDSGIHPVRLRQFLRLLKPDLLVFEDVRYTPPMEGIFSASQVLSRAAPNIEFFAALKNTASVYGRDAGIVVQAVSIQAIKKRATGKGNASKEDVIAAANAQYNLTFGVSDYKTTGVDNVADAIWCLTVGLESLARGCEVEPARAARRSRAPK